MALRPGVGLDRWEIAVAKKLVGEYRRRSQILERYEFDYMTTPRLSDGDIRAICDRMEDIAKADEVHVRVCELPADLPGRRVTFRFWWD